ncbi:MAG: response regulator [Campylobacterota bacterium]|nr:response regulator [Campylobacterota bacterium]
MENMINDLKNIDVLIVEDGQDIRDIMYSTLHKLFKSTRVAVDGIDGLEQFKENQPNIVLSDIRMPNMSGNDMVDEMKSINPNIPVIVITGHGRLMKKDIKADAVLEKPIKFNKLVEEIHKLI